MFNEEIFIPEPEEEDLENIGIREFQCFPPIGRKYRCIKIHQRGKKKFLEVYCFKKKQSMMIDFPIKPIKFTFYPVWVKYPDGTEQILEP